MKKVYLVLGLILETMACAGAWTIQHFTTKKMGMLRWVNHFCNKLTKKADIDTINIIIMIVLAALVLCLAFWAVSKVRERNGAFDALMCLTLGSAGAYIAYTAAYTRKLMAAYYLVSPVLLLGALLTIICFFAAVRKSR